MDALVLNIEKLSNDPVPNKKMTWLRGTNRSQGKLTRSLVGAVIPERYSTVNQDSFYFFWVKN